jgi:hypothetical protein
MLQMEMTQLKNYILGILKSPKRMLLRVGYVVMMTFVVWMNVNNLSGENNANELVTIGSYFSSGALALLIMMSYGLLKKSSVYFKNSEINMLFTAPINPRKILLFNLLKKIPTYLGTSVLTLVFALALAIRVFQPSISEIILVCVGYTLVLLVLEPLSFLLFVIASKLRKETIRQNFLKIFYAAIGGACIVLFYLASRTEGYTLEAVLSALSNDMLDYIPIIGWGRHIIMSIANGITTQTYVMLTLLIVTYIGLIVATYRLGDDYYEEVIATSEERTEIIKKAKEGKMNISFKGFNKKNVSVKKEQTYAFSFDWKRKLILKRKDISIYLSMETVMCIAIIALLKFFSKGNISEYGPYMACGMYFYVKFLFSSNTHLDEELKKPFFYLIPDKPMRKIIALVRIDLLRFFINISLVSLVHIILHQVFDFAFILLPFVGTLFYALLVFSSVLFKVFFPSNDVNKVLLLVKFIQMILLALPAFILMITIGTVTESVAIAFAVSIVVNVLVCVILLSLSEVLFEKLELR